MDEQPTAQTLGKREIVDTLDREFARLHFNSCLLIEGLPVEAMYLVPAQTEKEPSVSSSSPAGTLSTPSVGESVLRSAAAIEQTFGGITANLWDDPFEWTLPEYLSTPARVKEHLNEVEATRVRAFSSFADDASLLKHVAVPSGETRPLIDLLSDTLTRAAEYQAQALVSFTSLSGNSPAGFII
jgi:hypothetical protein